MVSSTRKSTLPPNETQDRRVKIGYQGPAASGGASPPPGGVENDMVGLMGGASFNNKYDVEAGRYNADVRGVQDQERAQWQLDQMLAANGPLMQRARAQGFATAGQRGLMNSSLAAGAAQGAMMDRAQPYVLQDANTYAKTASENMAAKNTAGQTNAQLLTQANIAAANLGGQMDLAKYNAETTGIREEANRRWQTGENRDQRTWQTGENRDQRTWQTGENRDQRTWQGDENEEQRDWQSDENNLQRDWQTGENTDQRDWQSGENQLNRDWTSEENMHQRMLQWATAELTAYTNMYGSKMAGMSQVLANIMSNPKLKADEQRAAWANAQVAFQKLFGEEFTPPPGFPTYPGDSTPPAGGGDGSTPPGDQPPPPADDTGDVYTDPSGATGGAVGNKDDTKNYLHAQPPLMPGVYTPPKYTGGTSHGSVYSPGVASVMDGLPDL